MEGDSKRGGFSLEFGIACAADLQIEKLGRVTNEAECIEAETRKFEEAEMVFGLFAIVGFVLGGILAWLTATARVTKFLSIQINEYDRRANSAEGRASGLEVTISDLRSLTQRGSEELASVRGELTNESNARVKAETQLKEAFLRLEEEKKLLEDAKASLSDTFKALAGDTLRSSTSEFLKLAKETIDNVMTEAKGDLGQRQEVIRGLVKPLSDSLSRFDEHVRSIEKDRQEAYAGLTEQVKGLATGQQQLQRETANLVTALRKPQVRGRWGELTLRRVVELAGMSEHCDFAEQVSAETEEGRQRPDLIVKLPADREIVVDAKVSLDAYLDATEADSEESRKSAMSRHAAQLRSHMNALAEKRYWSQFTKAPEFVVMFIPGESFFGAAVDADPTPQSAPEPGPSPVPIRAGVVRPPGAGPRPGPYPLLPG